MKNIVKFQIIKPQGNVTIDAFNPDFRYGDVEEAIAQYLPYTRLFEQITLKNFYSIPEAIITRLTNQYLHGTEIVVHTPKRNFYKVYRLNHTAPDFYTYTWKPLDLSAPIPRSLAEFEFEYNGEQTTYLKAIKTLTSTRYLPNEIWNALDLYSKSQINKCKEFNRGEYAYAEQWFKELMHDCYAHNMRMYSPNLKTYYEVTAEISFERDCKEHRLAEGLQPLTEQQLLFLQRYAPAYGVEIPMFRWKINSRKTDHGYTQEPEICAAMSSYDWTKVIYDSRNDNNLPGFVRQGLSVRECPNDKMLRDAYYQLKWIMKHLKDEGLMPGWKRCPVCHKLYRESEGCECGACESIEFVSADNKFYSNAATFEDYGITNELYNFNDTDFELEGLED